MTLAEFIAEYNFVIATACIALLISIFSFFKEQEKLTKLSLFILAFCIAALAALLDPFLNLWDERFHALVAKNMLDHPLVPTLYDKEILAIDKSNWDRYHIWVHKQPLFLWQITASFSLFGISEFSLRLPSVVLFAFLVLLVYRMGEMLVSRTTAYFAALLTLSSPFLLQLVTGRAPIDHNDLSFTFYVSMSLWAWLEYIRSNKKGFILLTGFAAGAAVLCKWLPGLLIYLGWTIYIVYGATKIRDIKPMIKALLITIFIALPWQLWTFWKFPKETGFVYKQNAQHFTMALDGHTGSVFYYVQNFDVIYGQFAIWFIIPAILVFATKVKDRRILFSVLGMVVFTYLFYSAAATKMPAFPLIVTAPLMIAFATLPELALRLLRRMEQPRGLRYFAATFFILALLFLRFDHQSIINKHFNYSEGSYSRMLLHNKEVFKNLKVNSDDVIFNVYGRHYIECMFYTSCIAYNFIPDQSQVAEVKRQERKLIVFGNRSDLPNYLQNDPDIRIEEQKILGYW